jgi:arylsulfatase A-like enzyme
MERDYSRFYLFAAQGRVWSMTSRILSVFAVMFWMGFAAGFANEGNAKPDILLIMPDQMRGDCLGSAGHPVVRTPNLDQLAHQGASFSRAYATCPSCIPSRHSLLTGLYPSSSGVVGYAGRKITSPTLPGVLAENGYRTVLVGRYMHQKPIDESYGYQKELRGSTYVSDDDYDRYLRKVAPSSGGIRELVANLGVSFNRWEAKAWPLADEMHPTAWAVREAGRVLKESSSDQPLFLTASFFAPHSPLFPPQKYFDYYLKQNLPAPAHGDWVNWSELSPKGDKQGHRVRLEGDILQKTMAGYFGLIEHLDNQIQPLIQAFQERSRKAGHSWLIIVTSDHGELLGDNGFYRKCEPYEGASRVPFIIGGSEDLHFQRGLCPSALVCLEDLMPTLLSAAHIAGPKNLDGTNLLPLLRGEPAETRDWLHTEHAPCYSKAQAFQALMGKRYTYFWRPEDGSEQLFDLQSDPKQEHDLSRVKSAAPLVAEWRARMIQTLADRPEKFTDGNRLVAARPYPPLQTGKWK